ncbi:hypothetical protein OYC64_017231 [Pagothenia borchgrevinki]|uniref:Uncharacterized protein n=1 Tax=Pagothenia borchgrevinki TaxID=8213 RepID=A0ABD2HNL4_PAGBO
MSLAHPAFSTSSPGTPSFDFWLKVAVFSKQCSTFNTKQVIFQPYLNKPNPKALTEALKGEQPICVQSKQGDVLRLRCRDRVSQPC